MNVVTKVTNGAQRAYDGVTARIYSAIANAPTTNLRILLTLAITLGTAIKYWLSGGGPDAWIPAWEWLIFLAGMAGLDVWQHHNKRKTAWSPKDHAEAEVIRNGNGNSVPSEDDVADESEIG